MMKRFMLAVCFVLLASPVWAFPDNAVLETFTGSDGTTPPNSNWTNAVFVGATSANLVIQDNAASTSSAGVDGEAYWDTTSFNANQEAYATIVEIANNAFGSLFLRLTNIGANTTDGYRLEWGDTDNRLRISRIDNGVGTALGADISQTITAGDSYGFKAIGSLLCAWYKVGAGAWIEVGCRNDGTYTTGGYIGLGANGSTSVGGQDSFGGGNASAVRPQPIFFK